MSMSSGNTGNKQERVAIRQLPTGVPGLDEIFGGGLPEYSFNIVAGAPGCGKTTMAHQFVFANASPERPAVYFTILGEPALKMLRYQQQYTFFDASMLADGSVRFVNLSQVVLEQDIDAVLAEIVKQVEELNAAIVVVDSFRTVARRAEANISGENDLQAFIQRLALYLTSWQVTSFLVGEYHESELRDNPLFTVADGLFWLYQNIERNSVVRKMQIMKLRGQASVPGLHTFRITSNGVQTFPRTLGLSAGSDRPKGERRLSTGIADFDALIGGGIPEGDSVLVAGPSGSGKSMLATQFIAEGLRQGEPGVIAVFEERPDQYVRRAAKVGLDLETPREEGKLAIVYVRPLDLSVDEMVYELITTVNRLKAKRVVLDSLAGFEMALAPEFRHEFRESLYRMVGALTGLGVTILSTVEIEENFTSMGLSNFAISFLADDIIRLRYVSINGQLRKMLLVVKMRGSEHSIDLWEYKINSGGIILGKRLHGFRGLTSGIPSPWSEEYGVQNPAPRRDRRPGKSPGDVPDE